MRRRSSITSWIIAVSTAFAMSALTLFGLSGAYRNWQQTQSLDRIEQMSQDYMNQAYRELKR
jgi:hypothetical protein